MSSGSIWGEIQQCETQLRNLEQEIKNKQKEIDNQEDALGHFTTKYKEFEERLRDKNGKVDNLATISPVMRAAKGHSTKMKETFLKVPAQIDALEHAKKTMRDELENNYLELERLEQQRMNLNTRISGLHHEYHAALRHEAEAAAAAAAAATAGGR